MIRIGRHYLAYLGIYVVSLYYLFCRPTVRRSIYPYLRHRFPEKGGPGRVADAYRVFVELGKVLVDRAMVGILGPRSKDHDLHGRQELLRLLEKQSGMILLITHVGCWQVALSSLDLLNRPVNLLLVHGAEDMDRQYFEHTGQGCPFNIIDPRGYLGGALEMLAALKRGEILCIMGDRFPGNDQKSVRTEFLGGEARFPFSAFKIASAANVPVVVFFSHRIDAQRYGMNVSRIIHVPEGLGRDGRQFQPYLRLFVSDLEAFCMAHPHQFFNFYNLWQ
jgi:predicted LPLAT superfamily acyltransferase